MCMSCAAATKSLGLGTQSRKEVYEAPLLKSWHLLISESLDGNTCRVEFGGDHLASQAAREQHGCAQL